MPETPNPWGALAWGVLQAPSPFALPVPVYAFRGSECSCNLPTCPSPGKHPYRGAKQIQSPQDAAELWHLALRTAEIGGMGLNPLPGFFVLDVDVKPEKRINGWESLRRLNQEHPTEPINPPDTLYATTPTGGAHIWFSSPIPEIKNTVDLGFKGSGLDIRGINGFVVAPPSPHVRGGIYQWGQGRPRPQPAPSWLLDLIQMPKRLRAPVTQDASASQIRSAFEELAKRRKKDKPELEKILAGHVYAFEGSRDSETWHIAKIIADAPELRRFKSEQIAQLFEASLSQMGPDAPSVDSVADKIERQRQNATETLVSEIGQNVKTVTGIDREPYSVTELAAYAPIQKGWIVKFGRKIYLWHLDMNGLPAYAKREPDAQIGIEAARHLDCACLDERINPRLPDGRMRPFNDLFEQYGMTVDYLRRSYTEAHATLDVQGKTLRLPALSPISIKPEFSADVHSWLEAISRDVRFWAWLATFGRLDRPTSALWLRGPKNTGKSLLARGLASLWGEGPCAFRDAIGRFNGEILNMPVVLADEGIECPAEVKPKDLPNRFKSLITTGFHSVEQKYQDATGLEGYVRVILTSNDSEPLRLISRLDGENAAAIADRIFLVDVSTEAADVLSKINPQEKGWIPKKTVAKHLLWLRDQFEASGQDVGDRFLVPGNLSIPDVAAAHEEAADFFRAFFRLLEHGLTNSQSPDLLMVPLAREQLGTWIQWIGDKLFVNRDRLIGEGIDPLSGRRNGWALWNRIRKSVQGKKSIEIEGQKWVSLDLDVLLTFAHEKPRITAYLERKIV